MADRGAGWVRPGIRRRVTLSALAIVAVALVVAAMSMIVLMERELTDDVRATAFSRAEEVIRSNFDGLDAGDDEFVQLIDRSGDVVAASQNVSDAAAIARLVPGESVEGAVPFDDDRFMIVSLDAGASGTVLVGRALDGVVESVALMGVFFAVGVPLLLAVIGWVVWRMVGRALAPVEAMRSEVDEISTGALHRRVPVPSDDDEVARLARTMNRMLGRLEDGQSRQRRFVSDASHELRSPVASLRQHAEVALQHPDSMTLHDLATTVLQDDLRLQDLVEDLLLLARMDEGEAASPLPVDLDDVVLEAARGMTTADGLAVDATRVSAGRVTGDRRQLERMVGNLLQNAARFARSTVRVSLRSAREGVILVVEDDGIGVQEPDRERVFERFVRLDEARDRTTGGAGLGLAIVAEVATAHGGSTRVMDSDLGGARFEVRLPQLT